MQTARTQITAAGALMAALTAHPDLPAPKISTEYVVTADRDPSGNLLLTGGLDFAFHDGLDGFEQWRQALGIDPATVDHDATESGTLAWLTATTTYAGVPLRLVGYYKPPTATAPAADE
ncbi:hypothetical protein ACIGZJ_09485 [Kitasatospora sp. NPDC052868]|uniref:hypothetical protein n=1 Tax=Kitasatospora sp. NPDC052868 TaxID=3364060 RepID=UPI0037CC5A6C